MMILNASGCLDALTAPAVARSLDAFVTKTVTPLPREGNPPPRIAEVEQGMLNSIGLANPGIDRFLSQTLPRLGELGVPVWVSVGGFTVADYADLCDRLDDRPEVEAIELNVSCPNVDDVPGSVGEIVAAGAASVALGTILFSDPDAPGRIRAELASEMAALAVGEADNVIGLAHAKTTAASETAAAAAALSVQ